MVLSDKEQYKKSIFWILMAFSTYTAAELFYINHIEMLDIILGRFIPIIILICLYFIKNPPISTIIPLFIGMFLSHFFQSYSSDYSISMGSFFVFKFLAVLSALTCFYSSFALFNIIFSLVLGVAYIKGLQPDLSTVVLWYFIINYIRIYRNIDLNTET